MLIFKLVFCFDMILCSVFHLVSPVFIKFNRVIDVI